MAIIVLSGGVAIGGALISNFFAWIFAEAKLLDAQATTPELYRAAVEKLFLACAVSGRWFWLRQRQRQRQLDFIRFSSLAVYTYLTVLCYAELAHSQFLFAALLPGCLFSTIFNTIFHG